MNAYEFPSIDAYVLAHQDTHTTRRAALLNLVGALRLGKVANYGIEEKACYLAIHERITEIIREKIA